MRKLRLRSFVGVLLVACTPTLDRGAEPRSYAGPVATLLPVEEAASPAEFTWALPGGVSPPPVPADNPMSDAKVALGRALFLDRRLSRTGNFACASCHEPALAFTDAKARAQGATGERHAFGTPSIVYSAYSVELGWTAAGPRSLEEQVGVPLLGETRWSSA